MILQTIDVDSPIGSVRAAFDNDGVHALSFVDQWERTATRLRRNMPAVVFQESNNSDLAGRLDDYFEGDLLAFDGLRLCARGTAFQEHVWAALQRIPAGETKTYGALAREIGMPNAARGVGTACNSNPIWILIPCHRVVGAGGNLVGYAGGLERKNWLLHHERAL